MPHVRHWLLVDNASRYWLNPLMQAPMPIQLDRRIVLLEPQPNAVNPQTGANIIADPIRHEIRAARKAAPGDDQIYDDTVVRRDRVIYTVRGQGGAAMRADATWEVEEGNRRYKIETIYEAPIKDGRRVRNLFLMIRAVSYD